MSVIWKEVLAVCSMALSKTGISWPRVLFFIFFDRLDHHEVTIPDNARLYGVVTNLCIY